MHIPEIWLWVGFNAFVLFMLALDLGVFNRKAHVIKVKEALIWSAVWITLALLFNVGVYYLKGPQAGLEFLTGYLVEKSLSVDNVFVFLLIFQAFAVPAIYQHKVLFWGVLGALVLRAIFIFAGVALIERFHWIIYLFGAFLVVTGLKMFKAQKQEVHPEKNLLVRGLRHVMPIGRDYDGHKFFTREDGRRVATPLFVVLLLIESTDLMFAVDSIPAILAISSDPFIVYTSNVFAILGLRSLYFALSGVVEEFVYLKYALAFILSFVGLKMILSDVFKVPTAISLGVIAAILLVAILASIARKRREDVA